MIRIQDLLKDGALDESKVASIAPTWRGHYRALISKLMVYATGPSEGPARAGPVLPPTDQWKVSRVIAALAEARAPEARQSEEVWKALAEAELPRKVHSVVRSILWKKLPLGERMHRMQMAESDKCPLCNHLEDHKHRVKKCPYLDQPIQLLRDLYQPVKDSQGIRV